MLSRWKEAIQENSQREDKHVMAGVMEDPAGDQAACQIRRLFSQDEGQAHFLKSKSEFLQVY